MFDSRHWQYRRNLAGTVVAGLALLLACSRPLDRPLEGARPPLAGEGAGSRLIEPPPTLVLATATPTAPLPIVLPAVSPSPSPALAGRNPILSGLLPAPESQVVPGPVNIGARISASTDLTQVSLTLDGAPVQPRITTQDARTWLVAYTSTLAAGKHEVRVNASDQDGRAGGYRWQFGVQARPEASPAAPARRP